MPYNSNTKSHYGRPLFKRKQHLYESETKEEMSLKREPARFACPHNSVKLWLLCVCLFKCKSVKHVNAYINEPPTLRIPSIYYIIIKVNNLFLSKRKCTESLSETWFVWAN